MSSQDLTNISILIKNEVAEEGNTKQRIAGAFDIVNKDKADLINGQIPYTQLPPMFSSMYKGYLKINTTAPNATGLYRLLEVGTYNKLTPAVDENGNSITIITIDSEINEAYYDGSVWKKVETKLPKLGVANEFDPNDDENAQAGKQITGYVNFSLRILTYTVNLEKDNFVKYSQLSSTATFSEGPNSVFGKVSMYKLTGGDVLFGSNFSALEGSDTYDSTKTNVITFWKEYNKVRYFVETFPLEPIIPDYVSYYNFSGKSPNTLLTNIAAESGSSFIGNTGRFKINTSSTMLTATTTATGLSDSIAINKGNLVNYKVTITMAFTTSFQFAINRTSATDYAEYIDILRNSPAFPTSTIKQKTTANPSGVSLGTTTAIPASAPSGYPVEILVNGNTAHLTINNQFVCDIPVSGTGNYFSMIFVGIDDFMIDYKLEAL
ncbi:hypothetical protein C1637_09990 [Chryseobacterium lactis]|uniref:Uncharacterized protein n=1 Tax=Chryseobacterium lactis TaxID=1241981 RepID=A0A3G6RH66_CHRLC|nr:hypothetical protein [Chryseobacterium lactis]AZA82158.1 hypothetical protein EG342_09705 [Chryseobacterium lactis]AZB02539.1 hypothetical protein EG341_00560 [Chryseobacterium lactis]PNW14165.1 hypothetical protein C1637_09990 [Chryseobacterium lactis]